MPKTLPHSLEKQNELGNIPGTEKWIAQNPWKFFLIILGCFFCSLLLHLNFGFLFSEQPDMLRHSLIGSWIVGSMCAYIYTDQLPPTPPKPEKKRKVLFTISPKTQRILSIIVLWILLLGSLSFCIYLRVGGLLWDTVTAQTHTSNGIAANPDKHDYLNPDDRAALEGEIVNLMFISADDIDRTGLSARKPVDMSARRKYFSDAGWHDYQKYVAEQKRRLISVQGNATVPLKARSEFVDGTRKYRTTGAHRSFSAEGIFLDAADTIYSRSDTFKLHVTYAPAGASGEVLITKWNVKSENLK